MIIRNYHNALIAIILSLVSICCSAQKPQNPMARIDGIIATGDTVTETGLYTPFVIRGAKVTPEMYETEKLLVYLDKVADTDAPDSYLGIVMHHNGDVVACHKRFIQLLFPDVKTYLVDGQNVTRADFDRIPASLLRTVTGEDNGQKLIVSTCTDVDDPNPAYTSTIDAEHAWFTDNRH